MQIAGKRSYNELAAHCFGKPGRNVVDVSISVMNLGSLVRWDTWVEQQQQAGRQAVGRRGAEQAACLADLRQGAALHTAALPGAGTERQRAPVAYHILPRCAAQVAYLNILADMFSLVANTVIPPGAEPSRNILLTCEAAPRWGSCSAAVAWRGPASTSCGACIGSTYGGVHSRTHTQRPPLCGTLNFWPGTEHSPPAAAPLPAAITLGAALPVALFVNSPRLLSSVSQASVAFIFFFSLMIAGMAFSQAPGKQA